MSRATVKTRIKTLLEGLTGYGAHNVKLGRDPNLLLGGNAKGVLIFNGGIQTNSDEWLASGGTDVPIGWITIIRICRRYTNEVDSEDALDAETKLVFDHLVSYPTLNGLADITEVLWQDAPEPLEIYRAERGGGLSDAPVWLAQDLPLLTTEYTLVTHNE